MVVLRKRETLTMAVTIGELDETPVVAVAASAPESGSTEATSLGMTFATIDAEMRQRFGLSDEASGVVVTDVESGGAAANRSIRPGDIIVEVGLEEVVTPDDVVSKINEASETDRKSVLLLLDSSGEQRFVAVDIDGG